MNIREIDIEEIVDYHQREDGCHVYTCKKKLWSVESTDKLQASGEAMHYWVQYWMDGEYDLLTPTVTP